MNGRTHLAIGLTLAAVAGANTPWQFVAVGIGSLLPDIDNAGAIARPLENLLPRIIPHLGLVKTVDGVAELTSKLVRKIFGHRGLTHWPVMVGLAWLLTDHLTPLALYVALGWIAHIYADALTQHGVPLGAPVSFDKVRLLPKLLAFRTGGLMEGILSWGLWGGLMAIATRAALVFVGVRL